MKRNCILALISCVIFFAVPLAAVEHPAVEKGARQTSATRLHEDMAQGGKLLVIDVRTPKEYAAGHAEGAVNVPLEELAKKIHSMDVSKDTTIVTMCEHGGRSSRAALELQKMGYKTTSYCRLDQWKAKGYKMAKGEAKPE
jgi:rhodanese-related sulfurtransferase